jgi:hypothetical protein
MHIVPSFFGIYIAVEMNSAPDSRETDSTSSTPSEWYTSRGARKPLNSDRLSNRRIKARSLTRGALDQHEFETAHHPLPEAWPEGIREVRKPWTRFDPTRRLEGDADQSSRTRKDGRHRFYENKYFGIKASAGEKRRKRISRNHAPASVSCRTTASSL